jgi:hypothetical protein
VLGKERETGWITAIMFNDFRFAIAAIGISLLGATAPARAQGIEASSVISPGDSIGLVHLGQTLDDVHRILGTPKLSNATISGQLWEVWRSGPAFGGRHQSGDEELEVFFRVDVAGGPVTVGQIRSTSSYFRTAFGVSISNTFGEIQNTFPALRRDQELTATLNAARSEKAFEIFVDRGKGIAFEFRNGAEMDANSTRYCRAVHVFRPGTNPRALQVFHLEFSED